MRHPHVVTVYGAERIDGRVGCGWRFIDGPAVEDEIRRRGPLSADVVARIGLDVSRALRAVHEAGLIHRDLKTQNGGESLALRRGDDSLWVSALDGSRAIRLVEGMPHNSVGKAARLPRRRPRRVLRPMDREQRLDAAGILTG